MWLVDRTDPRPGPGATALDTAEAQALRAVYGGEGTDEDLARALALLSRVRRSGYWIACDCRTGEGHYPLTSPAYLTGAGTYYLRRLTGAARANHAETCIFRFERTIQDTRPSAHRPDTAITAPDGYFRVLTPERASHVAAQSQGGLSGDSQRQPPRLARLLWRLMTLAGRPSPTVRRQP